MNRDKWPSSFSSREQPPASVLWGNSIHLLPVLTTDHMSLKSPLRLLSKLICQPAHQHGTQIGAGYVERPQPAEERSVCVSLRTLCLTPPPCNSCLLPQSSHCPNSPLNDLNAHFKGEAVIKKNHKPMNKWKIRVSPVNRIRSQIKRSKYMFKRSHFFYRHPLSHEEMLFVKNDLLLARICLHSTS